MHRESGGRGKNQAACLTWGVIACLVLVSLGVPVFAHAASETAASELKVVREYRTRFDAEQKMRDLLRDGKRVEVRKVDRRVALQRLELGVLPNLSEARAVSAKLKKNGLDSLIRRLPSATGYIVSLGAFSNKAFLAQLRSRVETLGFNNIRVVGLNVTQPRYQVVERVPAPRIRRIIQSSGKTRVIQQFKTPAPVAAAKPQSVPSPASAPARVVETRSREDADQQQQRLRQEGYASRIDVSYVTRDLNSIQLRVYPKWADAQRELPVLSALGLKPHIETDSRERGYAISLGLFSDPATIIRITKKVTQAGFRNVYVIPVTAREPRYKVVRLGRLPAGTREVMRGTEGAGAKSASAASESQPMVLVFGTPSQASELNYGVSDKTHKDTGLSAGLRDIRIEYGRLSDNKAAEVDTSNYLRTTAYLNWKPSTRWEWQLEGRVSAYQQTGKRAFRHTYLESGESFVRYRGKQVRVTLGTQNVIWGRIDEIPPTDRLSRADLRRYFLDDLPDRRLPVPSLRTEWFSGAYKTDLFLVPKFYGAKLPDINSIWSPIDKQKGELIGVKSTPLLSALIQNGRFADDTHGAGGAGIRVSKTGRGIDFALTLQRARQSTPYYALSPQVRAALFAGAPPASAVAASAGPTFTGLHPWTWVVGGDAGMVVGGATWRFELAWLSNVPVTTTDFRYKTVKGVDWAAGVEFFPGGGNARVNLQVAGHHLIAAKDVLDNQSTYLLNGALEDVFSHGRWRARLRFTSGLQQKDYYLNPEVAYLGWEPSEIYLGYHYFDGVNGTFGGFHKNDKMLTLGWRTSF